MYIKSTKEEKVCLILRTKLREQRFNYNIWIGHCNVVYLMTMVPRVVIHSKGPQSGLLLQGFPRVVIHSKHPYSVKWLQINICSLAMPQCLTPFSAFSVYYKLIQNNTSLIFILHTSDRIAMWCIMHINTKCYHSWDVFLMLSVSTKPQEICGVLNTKVCDAIQEATWCYTNQLSIE